MTYNLLTVDAIDPAAMAAALAACLHVMLGDVEVADPDGDPDVRNWDAPVSCDHTSIQGDLAWSLNIYAQRTVPGQPLEPDLAVRFAKATGTTVLCPASEAPPSAYWAATPQGLLTRARLELSDDESPVCTVTAVEAPVPQLPHAEMTHFEEIVREQRPPTPIADAFMASLKTSRESDSDLWSEQGSLVVWERVVVQLESGWAPSGWYPADLYRERLVARDALADVLHRLPRDVAMLLNEALERLDRRFVAATTEDVSGDLRRQLSGTPTSEQVPTGWWWHRRPDPVPWETGLTPEKH
ncbi:hypothetical protein [Streptomyces violascens]|uniref:hypothetical protein n=1 Tax=Streptomyces violascens TaxID=67381 RepID=UPI003681353A